MTYTWELIVTFAQRKIAKRYFNLKMVLLRCHNIREITSTESRRNKRGRVELPHVQGQGQWPTVPGCDSAGTAERSYPVSEVRGCSVE